MTSPWTPDIREALNALLAGHHTSTGDTADAGAALTVTDPDGHLAYRAPLARMSRIDDQDPAVLWIRPATGRTEPVDGEETTVPMYSLSTARRRSLAATTVHLQPGAPPVIVADLRNGQRATITAAAGETLTELADWDTFTLTVLAADDEAALEQLTEDSWHGPHA